MTNVWFALGLTVVAGLATGIGSALAFLAKRTNYRFLSVSTGFSAGVMLYVSFVEIFYKGGEALVEAYGEYWGHWINAASFFGGMFLIGVIDNLIPSAENPHETHAEAETAPLHDPPPPCRTSTRSRRLGPEGTHGVHDHGGYQRKLLRMGLFTALAIAIHNFPEGLATFLAALQDPRLGVAIARGDCAAQHPRRDQRLGAHLLRHGKPQEGVRLLPPQRLGRTGRGGHRLPGATRLLGGESGGIPSQVMGMLFGGVAGIMVYISLDELLPTSRAYGKGHDSLFGLVGGMVVMALSLLLMK